MKLDNDIKCSIQYFVYFLFKGTMDSRLIFAEYHYVEKLISNPKLLSNCFLVFADAMNNPNPNFFNENMEQDHLKIGFSAENIVANYILSLEDRNQTYELPKINELSSFWQEFLRVADEFFLNPYDNEFLQGLNGCGTDAVPYFAVWTNVIELDEKINVTNASYSLQRAQDRLSLMHGILPKKPFEAWELDQEIW
jgi:hypothetical protein